MLGYYLFPVGLIGIAANAHRLIPIPATRKRGALSRLRVKIRSQVMPGYPKLSSAVVLQSKVAKVNAVPPERAPRREGADALLAKNLVVARMLTGLTQHGLAAAATVSRATIAQLETGCSDPRLSTIVDLATALGIPPIFLLVGVEEVRALAALLLPPPKSPDGDSTGPAAAPVFSPKVPAPDLARMQEFVRSGMLKDRMRAARVGASVARAAGPLSEATPVSAGIFSAILPGAGTVVGAALAELLAQKRR